jgi:hypothetical protein
MGQLYSELEISKAIEHAKASYDAFLAASAARIIRYPVQPSHLSFGECMTLYRVIKGSHDVESEFRIEPLYRRAPMEN